MPLGLENNLWALLALSKLRNSCRSGSVVSQCIYICFLGRDLHAELRLLHQENAVPFPLPGQGWFLSAPRADSLAETLLMADHSSLQLACVSYITISKNRGGQLKKVWWWRLPDSAAVRLCACLLPAACPGHLTTVLRRAVMSYFGVTPIRKVAESRPCCARCCTCRGVTVPCPKETES